MPRITLPCVASFALCLAGACSAPAHTLEHRGTPCDGLIQAGETHFAHLWQVTAGGENAEGYWSFAGDRLSLQRRNAKEGVECDQIYVADLHGGPLQLVSTGKGATTCSYFLPGDREVLFASTHGSMDGCPPKPDYSAGYTWLVHPEFDLWKRNLETQALTPLLHSWGYDAEATVSPLGEHMVFTSTRSGDLELWTCKLDGSDLMQLTHTPGYDGGAFFSHDGQRLVFRATLFTPGKEAEELSTYRELLSQWKVRPQAMELMLIDADGQNRRQLTHLGGANFAPFFFPDDSRVVFATNHHEPTGRNFDLYAIGADGAGLERITHYAGFDSFPMFDPSGKYLVFASNRGGSEAGETNLFIAQWQ